MPNLTVSGSAARADDGTNAIAGAERRMVLRVIFGIPILLFGGAPAAGLRGDSVASKSPHDVGQFAAQLARLGAIAVARTRQVHLDIFADPARRRGHDRDPIGEVDSFIDIVGDVDDSPRFGEPG